MHRAFNQSSRRSANHHIVGVGYRMAIVIGGGVSIVDTVIVPLLALSWRRWHHHSSNNNMLVGVGPVTINSNTGVLMR